VINHEFPIQPSINPDPVFQIRYWNLRSGSELRNGMVGPKCLPAHVFMGKCNVGVRTFDPSNSGCRGRSDHIWLIGCFRVFRFGKGSGRCVDGMVAKSLASLELSKGFIKFIHAAAGERPSLPVRSYPGWHSWFNLIDHGNDHVDHPGLSRIAHKLIYCAGSLGSPGVCHWICDTDCNTVSRIRSGQGYACGGNFRLGDNS
jgi:hypothetical protein